jgi:hypothetical protein
MFIPDVRPADTLYYASFDGRILGSFLEWNWGSVIVTTVACVKVSNEQIFVL